MNQLELIVKNIDERIADLSIVLCSGRAATFEEYKHLCGEIRGFERSKLLTLELKNIQDRQDD